MKVIEYHTRRIGNAFKKCILTMQFNAILKSIFKLHVKLHFYMHFLKCISDSMGMKFDYLYKTLLFGSKITTVLNNYCDQLEISALSGKKIIKNIKFSINTKLVTKGLKKLK